MKTVSREILAAFLATIIIAVISCAFVLRAYGQAVGNGSNASPLLMYVDGVGITAPHVETATLSVSKTCLLAALCSLGTVTFQTPFSSAPDCQLTAQSSSAASVVLPIISAVSVNDLTISAYAVLALIAQPIKVVYFCVGNP